MQHFRVGLYRSHCRRVAYLCKHGPCSVCWMPRRFDRASRVCVCMFWTVTAWSLCFSRWGQDHCQRILQTVSWHTRHSPDLKTFPQGRKKEGKIKMVPKQIRLLLLWSWLKGVWGHLVVVLVQGMEMPCTKKAKRSLLFKTVDLVLKTVCIENVIILLGNSLKLSLSRLIHKGWLVCCFPSNY